MTAATLTASVTPGRPLVLCTPAARDAARTTATHRVFLAHTVAGDPFDRADQENLRRGVRYRVLLPEAIRDHPTTVSQLVRLGGAEMRTVDCVPAEMTVIDGTLALVPDDRATGNVAVVALPGVVNAVIALFDQLWESAVPLTGPERLGGREQELLLLLSAGYTDEAAAARLGVSVRTVRRTMAAIMERLGARSRFQAGLKAADRGLLVPRP